MSATTATTVPTGTYAADPVHSSAAFSVRHMVVSTFRGAFREIDAALTAREDGSLELRGAVGADSIDVRDPNLGEHLKSAEFFDTANHPQIAFVSRSLDLRPDGTVSLDGDFTVKGITRPVSATGTWAAPHEDAFGGTRVGLALEAEVNRQEFGLEWNMPLPKGGFALGDDVKLAIELELVRQGEEG